MFIDDAAQDNLDYETEISDVELEEELVELMSDEEAVSLQGREAKPQSALCQTTLDKYMSDVIERLEA